MISLRQWCNIGSGDVLLIGRTMRIVLDGPRDRGVKPGAHSSRTYITLMILRRSWTNRAQTLVNYHDGKHRVKRIFRTLKPAAIAAVCRAGVEQLKAIGFDPVHEAKRELKSEEINTKRRGHGKTNAMRRLKIFIARHGG